MKLLLLLLAACTTAPTGDTGVCATPDDAAADADVTLTAQDANLEPVQGMPFYAWTFDGDVPGPVLRIPLGDTWRIKLDNQSPRDTSLHFHGLDYADTDDGSTMHPESVVAPGCAHVYTVTAMVPGVWPYHSHVRTQTDMDMGLIGAVVVPDPAETPADEEFVALFSNLGVEMPDGTTDSDEMATPTGARANYMAINGRPFGGAEVIQLQGDAYVASGGASVPMDNMDMSTAMMPDTVATSTVGDLVRWRVADLSADDPHTFHIHGHRWCSQGLADDNGDCPAGATWEDDPSMLPAEGFTYEYTEDNPGDWMLHCHVEDHMNDGMWAMIHVDEAAGL